MQKPGQAGGLTGQKVALGNASAFYPEIAITTTGNLPVRSMCSTGITLAVKLVRHGTTMSLSAMGAVMRFTIGAASGRLAAACLGCKTELVDSDAIGAFALVVTSPGNATIVSVAGICGTCASRDDGVLLAAAREFLGTQVPPSFRIVV
jgi:hypothetical protein